MSVRIVAGGRTVILFAKLAVGLTAVALLAVAVDAAFAQGSPFGGPRPPSAPPPVDSGGLAGWLLAKQAQFYRGLSGMVRAAKADGTAIWGLFGLSFLYGVFHAAGPGHGKAVISSYLVANDETWRRGVVLSFASALLQALAAVTIVGVAAVLLHASAPTMNRAVRWIEILSYLGVVSVGLWLFWVKGREFLGSVRAQWTGAAAHHAQLGRGHHHHIDDHAGHSHGPEPQQLAGPGGWRRGLAAVVSVGLRPCSGAILVLVFALAQGLFWAGVASAFVMGLGTAITVTAIATLAVGAKGFARRVTKHRAGVGSLILRGFEVAAAVLIIAFGVLLLTGYMVNERMIGF